MKSGLKMRVARGSNERDAGRNRLDEDWHSEVDEPSEVRVEAPAVVLYDAAGRPLRRKIGFA